MATNIDHHILSRFMRYDLVTNAQTDPQTESKVNFYIIPLYKNLTKMSTKVSKTNCRIVPPVPESYKNSNLIYF